MRPTLELDLDQGGRGKVKLDDIELPFTTALRVEADVSGSTKVALEFLPAKTITRLQGVHLSARTVVGMEAICRQWRKDHRQDPPVLDMNALRAFELWQREHNLAVTPEAAGPAAFERFMAIYREQAAK